MQSNQQQQPQPVHSAPAHPPFQNHGNNQSTHNLQLQQHYQQLQSHSQHQGSVRNTQMNITIAGSSAHSSSFHELEAGSHQPSSDSQAVAHHHRQQQQQTPHSVLRIEQSSCSSVHPAPPPPVQQQRIFLHHTPAPAPSVQILSVHHSQSDTSLAPPPIPHPQLYIGSQRFATSILADLDSQPNISPKKKYRNLKKKFKYLVYENEYYQEELRNLQRKLLKLSRDKNFLLDRLGPYEHLSESSDEDSDTSTKTLEDRGASKQKKKPKQAPNRKRAAPAAVPIQGSTKRAPNRETPMKQQQREASKDTHNSALASVEPTIATISKGRAPSPNLLAMEEKCDKVPSKRGAIKLEPPVNSSNNEHISATSLGISVDDK